jgi:1-acyl-sn-glycerol-3-phosphate acyltransferase
MPTEAGWTWAKLWRIPATGLMFTLFGVGGFLIGALAFPLLCLRHRAPLARQLAARGLVQWTFARFISLMRFAGLVDTRIEGVERLNRDGLLVLANHPTLVDVVALISVTPNADCVVKARLDENPFTRGPIRAAGYIQNNGGADLLAAAARSLRAGGNLVIFPEGTRSRPGEALKMQRGAAQLALRAGVDITPVRIRCEPLGLTKGRPWWKTHDRPMRLTLSVGVDLPVQPFLEAAHGETALAARRLTGYLQHYFANED